MRCFRLHSADGAHSGGAALSAFLIGFIADSDWMLCIALVLSVGYALYRAYLSAFMYAWVLAAMTSAIVYLTTLAEPATGLHAAGYRTAEIIVGVIAGTYSSIYVAAPFTEWIDRRFFADSSSTKTKKKRKFTARPAGNKSGARV